MSDKQTVSLSEFASWARHIPIVEMTVTREQFARLVRDAEKMGMVPTDDLVEPGCVKVCGILVRDADYTNDPLKAYVIALAEADNELLESIPFKPVR